MDTFLPLVVSAWFITLIIQLVGWPFVSVLSRRYFVDRGWAISRVATWLTLSLLVWFSANLMLPTNTTGVLWFLLVVGIVLSGLVVYRHLNEILSALQSAWVLILIEEILFLLGFFGLSYIRCFNPNIQDLEKFMDAGFMASYVRSATLPAPDIWLSGKSINYYSFGQFLGSVMSRWWLTPIRYSYNLLLGLIAGLTLMESFSLVVNLLSPQLKAKASRLPVYLGGLIGAFLVTIGGNTHTIWYFLSHGSWQGYWYADATRFIERTIHEFPSYSFVVSDLHAHVWSLPLVLVFLSVVGLWVRALTEIDTHPHFYKWVSLVMGLFLGTFLMTSAWDLLIYGLLLAVLGFILLFYNRNLFLPLLISAGMAVFMALLTSLQWILTFVSISGGPQIATQHSPFWQLLVLWTGHVTLSAMAFAVALFLLRRHFLPKDQPLKFHYLVIAAMCTTAWILLILPELIFFKDIYTGHPRANTMFKFTYQAFILMSLTGGWVMGIALIKSTLSRWWRTGILLVGSVILVCVGLFPYFAYRDYYGALKDFKGLDGWTWLQEQYPDDYQAILWLQKNVTGQPTILESWGESYTTFDRVSAYTGLPTVIGWRVHEWLWRGGFEIAGKRSGEVDTIYKTPLSAESLGYLNQYQVHYIIVGAKEREAYPSDLNLTDLLKLGPVVFQSNDTRIIQYTPSK